MAPAGSPGTATAPARGDAPARCGAETSTDLFRRLSERPADLLRFATAGSVDDGKSTLIGRLLYDSKQVLADQLAHVEQASERKGRDFLDLSLLTDGLRAEREQGITIDVAYRYFATAQRRFIIADTPGHEQYTRNMVTGASTADLAIVLVDARKGVLAQSKRHAFISSLLGIPHVVVCVNKMDLVNFDEQVFDEIVEDFDRFAARLELPDVTFIPISALLGDNVVDRSEAMPWYQGPPLLYHLEHVHIASDRNLIDVRFPVQWVIRPPVDARSPTIAPTPARWPAGSCAPGDDVVVLPGGQRSKIASIDTYEGPIEEAFPPMSVALRLTDDIDVGRGSTIVRTQNQPTVANRFEALVCWMSEQPLSPGRRYLVKHTTRTAMVGEVDVRYRIDVETLRREADVTTLKLNDLARVHLELSTPLVFDSYRRNRVTGSLIMIDEATNDTVAAGVILDTEVEGAARGPGDRAQPQRALAGLPDDSRAPLAGARPRRRDALVHGPAGRRQVDCRGGRRGAAARGRPPGDAARRRQSAGTASTATWASTKAPGPRTSDAPRTSRGCWPSRARSRSSASSAPMRPTARWPPACTPRTTSTSSRSSSTRRWSSARSATRRASTPAPAPASCRG